MPKDKDKQSILHYFTSRIDFKSKTKEIREYIKAFFTENIETLPMLPFLNVDSYPLALQLFLSLPLQFLLIIKKER